MLLIKELDWRSIAEKHYNKKPRYWKFKCPSCSHIQSVESVVIHNQELTEKETGDWIYFNCEGRKNKEHGCDWTLGGLFGIHKVEVLREDGSKISVFEFADKKAMEEVKELSIKNPIEEKEKLLEVGTLWKCSKEFDGEPTSTSGDKARKIKVGEILEFRYPNDVHFRTVDNEYFYSNTGMFLTNCDYYGKIKDDIRFKNNHNLKEILEQKLIENKEG